MILLYPLVVIAAVVIVVRRQSMPRGEERWPSFLAWTASGALLVFSFLTGFSIGLFLLPFAAGLVAGRPRQGAEALGFLLGVGLVFLLVASIHGWRGGYLLGIAFSLTGVFGYAAALTRRERLRATG